MKYQILYYLIFVIIEITTCLKKIDDKKLEEIAENNRKNIDDVKHISLMSDMDMLFKNKFEPKFTFPTKKYGLKDLSGSFDINILKNNALKSPKDLQNQNVNLSKFFVEPNQKSKQTTQGFVLQNEILNAKNLNALTTLRLKDTPVIRGVQKRIPFSKVKQRNLLNQNNDDMIKDHILYLDKYKRNGEIYPSELEVENRNSMVINGKSPYIDKITILNEDENSTLKKKPETDFRLDILKNQEDEQERRKMEENDRIFRKQAIQKELELESDLSLIDPSEDEIFVLDDKQIYNEFLPGEEKLKKPMHKVGKPRKIAIRQHPESKGYRREDIEREEMKAKKIKKNEEIEFIESSEEAKHFFKTAGSPFRNIKKAHKDPLEDEELVVLDMPLEYTPEGLRDIVEAYFWVDFPIFNYEKDKINPPDDLYNFFETYPKINEILKLNSINKHEIDIIKTNINDLSRTEQNKNIREIIAERRGLLNVKDRPFSLSRSLSKGFKNIFLRRKSRKIREKFLSDLKNSIIEWSNEFDDEFPMLNLYPVRKTDSLFKTIESEYKLMNPYFKQRKELIEELLKNKKSRKYNESWYFDINLSKKLFPELSYDEIPDIKGVPVNEIIMLSSAGIMPTIQDFENTVKLIRNELIEAERRKVTNEDPLDPRKLRRHVARNELPPISATEEQIALWEIEQREKELEDEYDQYGHRKVELKRLPLNTYIDTPSISVRKPPEKKKGKLVVTDEEVKQLKKHEKDIYPIIAEETDKQAKKTELKRINLVLEKRDKVEANLRKIPKAFTNKIRVDNLKLFEENEILTKEKNKDEKELKRPHTTAMTHIDANFEKAIADNSKFNSENLLAKNKIYDEIKIPVIVSNKRNKFIEGINQEENI